MNPLSIILIIISYFFLLYIISYITSKDDSNSNFFNAKNNSKWYVVAFGMVGASLSGVTFISVPGWIESTQFSYFQVVLGYFFGYLVVCYVLLPIYYQLNVTSIYQFLEIRFGRSAQLTGAFYFFISRLLGASFRLFLVAIVLQKFIFDSWNIPFPITVSFSILLIWLYTYKGGINTIIWTDTIQTIFMLLSVILSIVLILNSLEFSFTEYLNSDEFNKLNRVFYFDNILERNYFFKSFFGGVFITICMTGLDQDMMQKNLTCRSLAEAQRNMISFSFILVLVTLLFMFLGSLLFVYKDFYEISLPMMDGRVRTDLLFPEIALNNKLGPIIGISFLLGLIAAAYSSADSALTSLTTSFCIDFMGYKDVKNIEKFTRIKVHVLMSLLLLIIIISFKYLLSSNVIDSLLTVASYTYGPLLGLFVFGIFSRRKLLGKYIFIVVILSPILTYILSLLPTIYALQVEHVIINCTSHTWDCAENYAKSNFYNFGYELLPINGLFTLLGLYCISKK